MIRYPVSVLVCAVCFLLVARLANSEGTVQFPSSMQVQGNDAGRPMAVQCMLSRKAASSSFLRETFSPLSGEVFNTSNATNHLTTASKATKRVSLY